MPRRRKPAAAGSSAGATTASIVNHSATPIPSKVIPSGDSGPGGSRIPPVTFITSTASGGVTSSFAPVPASTEWTPESLSYQSFRGMLKSSLSEAGSKAERSLAECSKIQKQYADMIANTMDPPMQKGFAEVLAETILDGKRPTEESVKVFFKDVLPHFRRSSHDAVRVVFKGSLTQDGFRKEQLTQDSFIVKCMDAYMRSMRMENEQKKEKFEKSGHTDDH